jgi:hypothetical protein
MKIYFSMLGLIVCLLYSCNKNEIDKNIVLKIGMLEITKYEFEKNKTRGLITSSDDSSAFNDPEKVVAWKKDYFDRCFIMVDAYEKKYDTISELQKQIQSVGDYMMVQKYGYLWKKTISPIVDSAKVVNDEKINKRENLFYFDYISCDSKATLLVLLNNDMVLRDKEAFLKLKTKCQKNKALTSGYFSAQWPFLAFWDYREYLFNMKEGHVSKLIPIGNNYMYFYLDHIEKISITEKEKGNLLSELQLGIEDDLIKKSNADMDSKCSPVFNTANINIIAQFLSKGNSIFQFNNDIELIQYTIDNNVRIGYFKKFLEYYSNQLMHHDIKDKETLIAYIKDFYNDDYLINEAKKLDLYNSDIFKLDRKNYQNGVFYGKYYEEEILKKIKIDSSEIVEYYNNNKKLFKQPKNVVLSMYVFANKTDAKNNIGIIIDLISRKEPDKTKNSATIKGLLKYEPDIDIDLENTDSYSEEFIHSLVVTPENSMVKSPLLHQGKYVLLYKKEETGESIKNLKEVYSNIEHKIRVDKGKIAEQELVKKLKTLYKIEIDKTGI